MTYKNGFYRPNIMRQKYFTVDSKPICYKGYEIYHRVKSNKRHANCFDIVKDNICISMMCGLTGAKRRIDDMEMKAYTQ